MAIEKQKTTFTGNELVILKILVALKKGGDVTSIHSLLNELPDGELKVGFEKKFETLRSLEALRGKEKEAEDRVTALFELFPVLRIVQSLWNSGGPDQKIVFLEDVAFEHVSSLLEKIYECSSEDCRIFLQNWCCKDIGERLAMLEKPEVQEELAKINFDENSKNFLKGLEAFAKQRIFVHEKRSLQKQRRKELGECEKMLNAYIANPDFVGAIVGAREGVTDLQSLSFDSAIEGLLKKKRIKRQVKAQQKEAAKKEAAKKDSTKNMLEALDGPKKETKPVSYSITVGIRWLFAEAFPLLVLAIAHRFSHKRKASGRSTRQDIKLDMMGTEMRTLPPQTSELVGGPKKKP